MKTILIALDYNPSAQKVAEQGYALAKAMKAEAVLVHVINDSTYYSAFEHGPIMGFPGYVNSVMVKTNDVTELRTKSHEYLDQIRKHLGDDRIKTEVGEGNTSLNILKIAKEINADLIVIGSHSQRWLEKVLLGSVAEEVLRDSTIPLYIIPIKEEQ